MFKYFRNLLKNKETPVNKNIPKFTEIIENQINGNKFFCNSFSSCIFGFIRVLKKYNYVEGEFEKSKIYIPNGYNNIENELKNLIPANNNQIILGIQGCDFLVGKSSLWKILEKTYGREKSIQIMPETYILANEEHMKLFLSKYDEGSTYILKKIQQRKMGILLTKNLDEILKAKEEGYIIVQRYIQNPLLINKRKINLRIYLLLTIKEGKIEAYINKNGTCIYNNKDYDKNDLDFESNITSYNLNYDIYDSNPLTLRQLRTYLIDNRYDGADELFNKIDDKVKLVIDAVTPYLGRNEKLKNNLCAQVFGMDFIIDDDLNPYYLESNKGPDMNPRCNTSFSKLISDVSDFQVAESLVEKCYSNGYVSGNGIKAQLDALNILGLIDSKFENGFYKI